MYTSSQLIPKIFRAYYNIKLAMLYVIVLTKQIYIMYVIIITITIIAMLYVTALTITCIYYVRHHNNYNNHSSVIRYRIN